MFHDSGSTSQNIGVACDLTTADRQDIIVNDGIIISSSFFKSKTLMASSSATVPLDKAIAYFLSKYFDKSSSNLVTISLVPEISFLLMNL